MDVMNKEGRRLLHQYKIKKLRDAIYRRPLLINMRWSPAREVPNILESLSYDIIKE